MKTNLTSKKIFLAGAMIAGITFLYQVPTGKNVASSFGNSVVNSGTTYFQNQQSNSENTAMKPKPVTYKLEASRFEWELAPGKVNRGLGI
ncbi:hypothetical protein NC796_01645 [Aliifodinibius sp. S!AR15-10]|uniref:hypothetical protein n=1 Tax=Aliifodinibius sp. S!AR15-10 TaxID=2950437 RepID=UPI0028658433|nr:hypothetical protein [Aliifodinibius sp. S!AR15-10]MDR8389821.1 hypothetical protein [Aliifodinibius sp. S!AR15-10]